MKEQILIDSIVKDLIKTDSFFYNELEIIMNVISNNLYKTKYEVQVPKRKMILFKIKLRLKSIKLLTKMTVRRLKNDIGKICVSKQNKKRFITKRFSKDSKGGS